MRRTMLATALAVATAAAPPAAGQGWQVIGTPDNSNTGAYWNNASDDNVGSAVCNAGAILTNTPALTNASCTNQRPATLLPLVPARLRTSAVFLGTAGGSNPGGFQFSPGAYRFDEIARVAANTTTTWGAITNGGTVYTSSQLLRGGIAISGPFAIWITQALPPAGAGTLFTSNQQTWSGSAFSATAMQQFVVFTGSRGVGAEPLVRGGVIDINRGDEYYIGMEDNTNGGRGFGEASADFAMSDRDYNDIIIRISTVPEPSSWALVLTGLVMVGAASRRRRA